MNTKTLEEATELDLVAELNRKRKIANAPPVMVDTPDLTSLIRTVKDCIAQAINDEYENDDFSHYVYEETMKALYGGNKYFEWRNRQSW